MGEKGREKKKKKKCKETNKTMSNDCDSNKRVSSSSPATPAPVPVQLVENEATRHVTAVVAASAHDDRRCLFDGCDRPASPRDDDDSDSDAKLDSAKINRPDDDVNACPHLVRQSCAPFAPPTEKPTRPRGYVPLDRQKSSQSLLR